MLISQFTRGMGETMKFKNVAARGLMVAMCLSTVALVALPGISQAKTKGGATKAPTYYVSLGDSYSVGYQPIGGPFGEATSGYTGFVASKLKMTLVNFGCGGETTASILDPTAVCLTTPTASPPPNSFQPPAATNAGVVPLGESQVQAADAFITAHSGHVGLITVSIGGNDVTPCAGASPTNLVNGQSSAILCVAVGVTAIKTNVKTAVDDLRAAAGSSVPIVGLTYPDVLLGLWVHPTFPASAANLSLAKESVGAFSGFINPALKSAYTSVTDRKFVDVTMAMKYTTPLTKLANLAPYGKIPKAVAEVCQLTYYCSLGNIHANTKGYTEIGKLIKKALK